MSIATPKTPVDQLADRFWEWFLATQPLWATLFGDERYDDRLDDPSEAGRSADVAALEGFRDDIARVDADTLDVEDRITLDILEVVVRMRLRAHEHRTHHFDGIDQLNGPQQMPGDLARFHRLDSPERVERLLCRLEAYPAYIAAVEANIREGIEAGRTAARPVVERTITQVRRAVETPLDGSPLLASHPDLPEEHRAAIRAALESHVQPALESFLGTLEGYIAHARAGEGICWLPDGEELYRFSVLASTTLEEDPRALHDYGLSQLEAIRAEADEIARRQGHETAVAYRAALDSEAANHAAEPGELVRVAEAQIERAQAVAPHFFGRLPRAACEVRPVEPHQEEEAPPAFYYPPAPDGSRPGIYYINTFDPASRPLHRIAATTYHEAVPGHHFQIALEGELDGLPAFRRLGSRLAGSAYPEGWGLYSERLADEMGLYEDPAERFGMLQAQAFRAARLVVDTGIHAFRWDRERAVAFMRSEGGLSALEAETEVDRYIAWPGQALAYMTGQREIEALRRALEARDGDRFDLRAFHDAVLAHGSLPLATLRMWVPRWVSPAG
jgi:uncharacterized protein (DUF885 family)